MRSSAQTSVQRFSGSVNPFKKQGKSTTGAKEAVHREKEKMKEEEKEATEFQLYHIGRI